MNRVLLIGMLFTASLGFSGEKKPLPEYALIFVTIFDAGNVPVPGVKVKIRKANEKKAQWELVSDRRGELAQRVPAGKADYVLSPQLRDRHAAEKAQVIVHIENDERQDITLHLINQEHTNK